MRHRVHFPLLNQHFDEEGVVLIVYVFIIEPLTSFLRGVYGPSHAYALEVINALIPRAGLFNELGIALVR